MPIKSGIEVSVQMTRPSFGDGRKAMCIEIRDQASGIRICEVEIPYEDFVVALTSGIGYGTAEVAVSDNIGKVREVRRLEFDFDSSVVPYEEREEQAYQKACLIAPSGWEVSKYFGSKGQIPYGNGKGWVNIYRYVDKENKDEAI